MHHRTHDGRAFPTLNILDEFTRESLAIRVRRKLSSVDVIDVLTDLFILRGIPTYIRSDNGPEWQHCGNDPLQWEGQPQQASDPYLAQEALVMTTGVN